MYLINLLAEKIKSFRANESKSHTDLYAREYGIPVFNLNTPDVQKVLYEIKDWLEVNNT